MINAAAGRRSHPGGPVSKAAQTWKTLRRSRGECRFRSSAWGRALQRRKGNLRIALRQPPTALRPGSGEGLLFMTATKVGAGSFVKVAQRLEAKMLLPFYLVLVTVLFPPPAAGQSHLLRSSHVTVRADPFACKETSELDRLLQRNQSGGFTSGAQLYHYLKAHKCMGLTAGSARVSSTRGQYVCIYDPKDNKTSIYPCAWTRTEMLSK